MWLRCHMMGAKSQTIYKCLASVCWAWFCVKLECRRRFGVTSYFFLSFVFSFCFLGGHRILFFLFRNFLLLVIVRRSFYFFDVRRKKIILLWFFYDFFYNFLFFLVFGGLNVWNFFQISKSIVQSHSVVVSHHDYCVVSHDLIWSHWPSSWRHACV